MEKKGTIVQSLVDILVKHQVISEKEGKDYAKAFKNSSKESFDAFLMDEDLVDDLNVLRALSEYYQVPAFDVVGYFFDHALVQTFPKSFLLRNVIIPLEVDENILVVVASDPSDEELLPKIGEYVSYDIQFRVGLRRDIEDAIKEFYDQSLTDMPDEDSNDRQMAKQKAIDRVLEKRRKLQVPYEKDEPLPGFEDDEG